MVENFDLGEILPYLNALQLESNSPKIYMVTFKGAC